MDSWLHLLSFRFQFAFLQWNVFNVEQIKSTGVYCGLISEIHAVLSYKQKMSSLSTGIPYNFPLKIP